MATSVPSAVDITLTMAPKFDPTDEQLEDAAFAVLAAAEAHRHAAGPVVSVDLERRGIRLVFTLDEAYSQDEVRRQAEDIVASVMAAVDVAPVTNATAKHEVAICT